MIAVEDLAPLPVYLRYTLVEADLDANGHLNVRRYMGLFDDANWGLYAAVGMTQDYFRNSGSGAFALEMHLHYYAEIRLGETVTVRTRLLAHSAKRIHYISFMLNETTRSLAATLEGVDSHADLTARRTSAFPTHVAANLDALLAEHQRLAWEAPLCGVLHA